MGRIIDKNDVKHPLIKALLKKGYTDMELIYDPYWSTDWGWTDVIQLGFLGYNTKHALRTIANLPDLTKGEKWNHHKSYMSLSNWMIDDDVESITMTELDNKNGDTNI